MRSFLYQHIHFYVLALILLLGLIAFSPVLYADFINYDDPEYVINNPFIRDFSIANIEAIFSGEATLLYVPLTIFSYLIEYSLFGANATVFHVVNLALHLLNSVLVYKLLLKLNLKNMYFISWVLIFFTLNPLVSESVCWITERKDMLYAVFFLLAILQFLEYTTQKDTRRLTFSFLLFVAACLCKPMAVSFPFILLVFLFYQDRPIASAEKLFLFLSLMVSLVFACVSAYSLRTGDKTIATDYTFLQRAYLVLSEVGYYFLKPFFPVNQQLIHPFPNEAALWQDTSVFRCALGGIVVIGGILYSMLKTKNKVIVYLFLAWLIFLVPVLQFYPNTYSYVSERYFYISIIFPAAILFLIFKNYKISSYVLNFSVLPVLICFCFLTFQRSSKWLNSGTLFEEEVRMDSRDPYALTNLGLYYNTRNEFSKAKKVLAQALVLDPQEVLILNNYGWALAGEGQIDAALIWFNKAFRLKGNYVPVLNNIGICHLAKNNVDSALVYFDKAFRLDNKNNETMFNIAACYLQLEQTEIARPWLIKARELGNLKAEKYLRD